MKMLSVLGWWEGFLMMYGAEIWGINHSCVRLMHFYLFYVTSPSAYVSLHCDNFISGWKECVRFL